MAATVAAANLATDADCDLAVHALVGEMRDQVAAYDQVAVCPSCAELACHTVCDDCGSCECDVQCMYCGAMGCASLCEAHGDCACECECDREVERARRMV